MGQALITRGGGVGGAGKAKVQVTAPVGATLTISQGDVVFTKTVTTGYVEISLGFGVWQISSNPGRTETIEIDVLKVYEMDLNIDTFGIAIDMMNESPSDAVTYIDGAVGFTPLSCDVASTGACNYGSWQEVISDVIGCRPCLYKDGAVVKYLNPNDYSKDVDGGTVDITSGNAGDVMVEFKKTWYKFSLEGNTLKFQISKSDKSSEGFVCSAFKSMDGTGTIKDYMYFSAYEGYTASSKCRSLSGKTPANDGNCTYTNYRTYSKALGASYGMEDWIKRSYILGLLMLVTKTRGIQDVLGAGNLDSGSKNSTGTTNNKGLFYGLSDSSANVKAFGIENLWGNTYSWCDGIYTLSESTVGFKDGAPYNDSGTSYESVTGIPQGSGGCISSVKPILNGASFFMSAVQSNYEIGWQDYGGASDDSGYVALVGGRCTSSVGYGGPFCVYVNYYPSDSYAYYSGRLVSA